MTTNINVIGRFGRVALEVHDKELGSTTRAHPQIIFKVGGSDCDMVLGNLALSLSQNSAVALNSWATYRQRPLGVEASQIMSLSADPDWLALQLDRPLGSEETLFRIAELPVAGMIRMCRKIILFALRAPNIIKEPILERQMSTLFRFALARNGYPARSIIERAIPQADERIERAIAVLNDSQGQISDSKLLASVGHVSRSQLFELFKEATDITPLQYATALRVEHAVSALCDTDAPLSSVALELGFSSQANFSRFMKHHVGLSPGKFRRACLVL